MAQKSVNSLSNGFVILNFKLGLNDELYISVCLTIIKGLCCDVVLGCEFQSDISKLHLIMAVKATNIAEPTWFPGISNKYKLTATKSRCFNKEGFDFIAMEIGKLQKDGIIESNMSP